MQKTPHKNVSFKGSIVQFAIFCMGNEDFSVTYFGVRMVSFVSQMDSKIAQWFGGAVCALRIAPH
jgi:hypothetical protein